MPYTSIIRMSETDSNIGYNSQRQEFYINNKLMLNVPFIITYSGDEIELLVKADVDDNEELMIMKDFCYADDSYQTQSELNLFEMQEFHKLIREV